MKVNTHEWEQLDGECKAYRKQLGELKQLRKQEDSNRMILEERVNDLTGKNGQYQNIITELSTEVHRLNELLKNKLIQINEI